MTTLAVVGAGPVGVHATRHLLADDGVDRIVLHDADTSRARTAVDEIGGEVEVAESVDALFEAGPVAAAAAVPDPIGVMTAAVERGVGVVGASDDLTSVRDAFDLDAAAQAAGVALIVGAGLAPGLSEVLARYAAERVDSVDEIHVARYGVSGRSCARSRRIGAWGRVNELEDGAWNHPRSGTGRRLVAFPDPVGTHDCRRVASAVPWMVSRAVPDARRATFRDALRRRDRFSGRVPLPVGGRTGQRLGGLHVEVRGRRGSAHDVQVYGTVDFMASLVGAVVATATLVAAGLVAALPPPVGAVSLGEVGGEHLLVQLAQRGVRAAEFHGRDPHGARP